MKARTERLLASGLVGLLLIAAQPVRADVIEIADDGAVHVRGGAGAVWQAGASVDADVGETDAEVTAPDLPEAAMTRLADVDAPADYRDGLAAAAASARVSPDLLAALVWQESRWRPAAVSRKGAFGLTQLMPATARSLAVDPRDASANLAGGARYLRQMLDMFDGDVERALAAYNAGPARVIRAKGVPLITETRAYVGAIIDRLARTGAAMTGLTK